MATMKNVLIINPLLKQYRLSFFEKLHSVLERDNIHLKLIYADPPAKELCKADNVEIASRYGKKVGMSWLLNGKLGYQHIVRDVMAADLVIADHSFKYVFTLLGVLLSTIRLKKVALWGHGRNLQATRANFTEWVKMRTLNNVDWWFVYTQGGAEYLQQKGVPHHKITVTQNTLDMEDFRRDLSAVTPADVDAAREQLNIPPGATVALYCGSLYPDKMLSFLLSAVARIREKFPDFHLIIVGDGEERELVEQAVNRCNWVHFMGSRFGREKALYFKLAQLFLHPGAVGLAVLDAFNAGLPMVTTDIPIHGPEVEYLVNGVNGLVLPADEAVYAEGVCNLLGDEVTLAAIGKSAAESAHHYSLDAMVHNYRSGILACLGITHRGCNVIEGNYQVAGQKEAARTFQ
jgi:glycosyltransferase involved in cell wall biosynthesis